MICIGAKALTMYTVDSLFFFTSGNNVQCGGEYPLVYSLLLN